MKSTKPKRVYLYNMVDLITGYNKLVFWFFFGFGGEVAGDRRAWYCTAQVVLSCAGKKGLPRR